MARKQLFELIGKTPAVFDAITPLAEKAGQKNSHPAVDVTNTVSLANKQALAMLHPDLLKFCYTNTGKGTGQLDGIQVVSDWPNLTEIITRMGGEFSWEYEQTGCKVKVYEGNTAVEYNDVTVKKIKVVCHEGGTVDLTYHWYTADVDEERAGMLALLKSQTRDMEVTAPDAVSDKQGTLDVEDGDGITGATVTPLTALKDATAKEKRR